MRLKITITRKIRNMTPDWQAMCVPESATGSPELTAKVFGTQKFTNGDISTGINICGDLLTKYDIKSYMFKIYVYPHTIVCSCCSSERSSSPEARGAPQQGPPEPPGEITN